MAIDYPAIAEGALQGLTDAGSAMTLAAPGTAAYDPATATTTTTTVDHACTGVMLPPGSMDGSGFTFGPDVLVRAEAIAYVAAHGLAVWPKPGYALTVGADRWLVIGSDSLAPAGTAVLHALALVAAPPEEGDTHGPSFALEDGAYLLLEDGARLLLE